ncbi:bifunctional phosphopantothenoylcysteine decarboxylase/phosphopantothenate--cysteine ligase CoaBC [Solimonas soli]|uniref:bifunctional phosphopantothenoylcysteine decarboxylase/phosphopantothenate--cysteine ligase CoaBC n=1 Tax=Solimonas soli TaxID=413479 RepID=UPI0005BDA79A|nr:bifunctional phosphopantothenoylcysteine decarboxylase/phosphopantothenate--cysteine ligase CoaBC [Solimonas soli]
MSTPQPSVPNLADRRILLAVTGGIAAYKAADLTRRLMEAGAEVQVVMTAGAQEFVTPLTFQALSGRPVRTSLLDPAAEAAMGHIELARWPDLILVAPASADVIAKLALGLADDLLSTLALATDKPIVLAPAMNRLMWGNPATQANVATLVARGVQLIGPGSGFQACGEIGDGRMSEPLQIREAIAQRFSQGPLAGVKAVVTAGPTREAIDPVRFISNRSSGKMGYALAGALRALGADVALLSGPTSLSTPSGVRRVDIESAQELLDAALRESADAQIFVGAAAVADYRVEQVADEKIKKKDATMALTLSRNPDVISTVRERDARLFVVGFAAETEKLEEHARGKLARKKLDLIAANWVGRGRAFDRDDNALSVYWNGGGRELPRANKAEIARELAALIAERYARRVT